MIKTFKTTIDKINLILFFGLCLGYSNRLYAAQNEEIDDEKKYIGHQGLYAPQNNKKQIVAIWSCSMCTFDNLIDNKKCAMCGAPHPLLSEYKASKHDKNKLSEYSLIDVKFMDYEIKKDNNESFHVISKIACMIRGEPPFYKVTPLDISIFNRLISGAKDILPDLQQKWNKFWNKQQSITIRMRYMYEYYKEFIPVFFDSKCKNLLLLDTIAQLFPNATEIICENIDWDGDKIDEDGDKGDYSPDIVSSKFISRLRDSLSKMPSVKKIIIKTYENEIKNKCNLHAIQLDVLGWQVGKGGRAIVFTKEPYDVICKDVIPKISAMIKGEAPAYAATSLDVPIFNQLISDSKDVPSDVQQIWNEFRHQQQNIKINMEYMYKYYKVFMPQLFSSDPKFKNLFLFDKIAKIFPNVTEIICEETDWDEDKGDYSSAIVDSNFISRWSCCIDNKYKEVISLKNGVALWGK